MDRTDLISLLKTIRKAKKKRQQEVARWSGLTQGELSNIENGHVDIRISTLKRIAEALDLKIIAVPKERLDDIETLLNPSKKMWQEDRKSYLLEKYGVSDDD